MSKRESILKQLRESAPAQALDKVCEATDQFLGPSAKAWAANGLDELRQVFVPGVQQIQPGNNPGLFGTITTGEATYDRMGEFSLDDLRASALNKETEQSNENAQEHERGMER